MAKKNAPRPLAIGSRVYSIAIKCYAEQLTCGIDALKQRIQQLDQSNLPKLQVLAIVHDRDIKTDGIWACAQEKPHLHIIARCVDRKSRFYVSQFMNYLGIYFRPGLDDQLWRARGVETAGNFAGYANYLTHETTAAMNEGKELYDVTEIISNLTLDEINRVREGYIHVAATKRLTDDDFTQLDKEAFDLGYQLKDFDDWYNKQPFNVRNNSRMRTVKESYSRGIDQKISEHNELNRICVFIRGEANTGKTYAAREALKGKKILTVGGGGTGKFDNLKVSHDAIIIDDDVCPNLLNMSDNYICRAYRRGKNNPAWCGEYLIVTSNLSFCEWIANCGIKQAYYGGGHYDAVLSRFFICEVSNATGYNQIYCTSISTRGSQADKAYKMQKFAEFKKRYNEIIKQYQPTQDISYDYMIDTIPAQPQKYITNVYDY